LNDESVPPYARNGLNHRHVIRLHPQRPKHCATQRPIGNDSASVFSKAFAGGELILHRDADRAAQLVAGGWIAKVQPVTTSPDQDRQPDCHHSGEKDGADCVVQQCRVHESPCARSRLNTREFVLRDRLSRTHAYVER
jgi:hypothetical protein